jgi:hypothetical protein
VCRRLAWLHMLAQLATKDPTYITRYTGRLIAVSLAATNLLLLTCPTSGMGSAVSHPG